MPGTSEMQRHESLLAAAARLWDVGGPALSSWNLQAMQSREGETVEFIKPARSPMSQFRKPPRLSKCSHTEACSEQIRAR